MFLSQIWYSPMAYLTKEVKFVAKQTAIEIQQQFS